MLNRNSEVSKCIEIFVWMMWRENFILLRELHENTVEKNIAGLLSNTRIMKLSKS